MWPKKKHFNPRRCEHKCLTISHEVKATATPLPAAPRPFFLMSSKMGLSSGSFCKSSRAPHATVKEAKGVPEGEQGADARLSSNPVTSVQLQLMLSGELTHYSAMQDMLDEGVDPGCADPP
eukprot:1557825-Amphidinium_carterae.1